ncbi:hypothetical protein CRG98_034343 [Punica granatum]|uniref:Gamma-glutamyltranspeptidase 1-like n=1 Tax=Punica granatum TaxID=22663 RepID=A0A2I0INH6_PUNGR|nr:hypothetical protein CRG98_034343 [Punica granatum]
MILILNILSLYGFPSGISGSLGVHRTIEALKHAFAVKMNLGDPEYVNISAAFSDMMSVSFAKELKKTIYDNMTFSPGHYGGRWNQIHDHGTSHISVIDRECNAVSMTSTAISKGSSNVPPPAPANFIRPGKRSLTSMSPTIVLMDGRLKAVIGASGGGMITAGTTEVFLNHFAKGMDPFSSVISPRFYHHVH